MHLSYPRMSMRQLPMTSSTVQVPTRNIMLILPLKIISTEIMDIMTRIQYGL